MLAGPEEFIAQARVWRRRHGGTLKTLFPLAAAALPGLDALPARMPDFLEHARALASALKQLPNVFIVPDPPQTPLFHVHLRGEKETLQERSLQIARDQSVWLFHELKPTVVPGFHKLELNIGEPGLEIWPAEAAQLFAEILRA